MSFTFCVIPLEVWVFLQQLPCGTVQVEWPVMKGLLYVAMPRNYTWKMFSAACIDEVAVFTIASQSKNRPLLMSDPFPIAVDWHYLHGAGLSSAMSDPQLSPRGLLSASDTSWTEGEVRHQLMLKPCLPFPVDSCQLLTLAPWGRGSGSSATEQPSPRDLFGPTSAPKTRDARWAGILISENVLVRVWWYLVRRGLAYLWIFHWKTTLCRETQATKHWLAPSHTPVHKITTISARTMERALDDAYPWQKGSTRDKELRTVWKWKERDVVGGSELPRSPWGVSTQRSPMCNLPVGSFP